MFNLVRILKVKEEEISGKAKKRLIKNRFSTKWKLVSLSAFVALTVFGLVFVATLPGVIFNPYKGDYVVGWADIHASFVGFNGELEDFEGECSIYLFYAVNGTKYEENLTLSDFPYLISEPTTFLINDTSGEFQFQYAMLLGNPKKDDPFVNQVIFKREAYEYMLNLGAKIVNFTYSNYSNVDLLDPIITSYELMYNASSSQQFQFGAYDPLLKFDLTDLPSGYTWGASTYVPPDYFETMKNDYEIAYRNGFNRIGLYLAFECNVNVSVLLYGAENYQFFCEIQTYQVNLTQEPEPEKLWVAPLHDVDISQEITFQFETVYNFSRVYMWSGWLDDYNSSFVYNNYNLIEV